MNFQELASKLKSIEENTDVPASECGAMPVIAHADAGQQDNVTMSVSMNGQGAGGIKSLMDILRNIEQGQADHKDNDILVGEPDDSHHNAAIMGNIVNDLNKEGQSDDSPFTHEYEVGEEFDDSDEKFANSAKHGSGKHTHGIDAVTFSGDDLASKGKISPLQRAPGTNSLRVPSNFSESLKNRLQAHYEEIKNK